MGQTYVPVSADMVNDAMPLSSSSGFEEGGYWLYWNEDGYTGQGWHWGEENNYIHIGWPNALDENGKVKDSLNCTGGHAKDENGLRQHISMGHADDLNAMLGPWPTGKKMQFVGAYYDLFKNNGCLQ